MAVLNYAQQDVVVHGLALTRRTAIVIVAKRLQHEDAVAAVVVDADGAIGRGLGEVDRVEVLGLHRAVLQQVGRIRDLLDDAGARNLDRLASPDRPIVEHGVVRRRAENEARLSQVAGRQIGGVADDGVAVETAQAILHNEMVLDLERIVFGRAGIDLDIGLLRRLAGQFGDGVVVGARAVIALLRARLGDGRIIDAAVAVPIERLALGDQLDRRLAAQLLERGDGAGCRIDHGTDEPVVQRDMTGIARSGDGRMGAARQGEQGGGGKQAGLQHFDLRQLQAFSRKKLQCLSVGRRKA